MTSEPQPPEGTDHTHSKPTQVSRERGAPPSNDESGSYDRVQSTATHDLLLKIQNFINQNPHPEQIIDQAHIDHADRMADYEKYLRTIRPQPSVYCGFLIRV